VSAQTKQYLLGHAAVPDGDISALIDRGKDVAVKGVELGVTTRIGLGVESDCARLANAGVKYAHHSILIGAEKCVPGNAWLR
jgi:hypothetical protein